MNNLTGSATGGSPVLVQPGAILSDSRSIQGGVTINSQATFSPSEAIGGLSVGRLDVENETTLRLQIRVENCHEHATVSADAHFAGIPDFSTGEG